MESIFQKLHDFVMKLFVEGEGVLWGRFGDSFQMKIDFDKSIGKEKIHVEFSEWTEEQFAFSFKDTKMCSGFFILEGLMISKVFFEVDSGERIIDRSLDSIEIFSKILADYYDF
jgi:hypothetical protein